MKLKSYIFFLRQILALWTDYVLKFDKLIEEALTISARESFQSVCCTLRGNGVLGPNPLIYVTLDVQEGKVANSLKIILKISLDSN